MKNVPKSVFANGSSATQFVRQNQILPWKFIAALYEYRGGERLTPERVRQIGLGAEQKIRQALRGF